MYRKMLCTNIRNLYCCQRKELSYFTVKEALRLKPIDNKIVLKGWVQSIRKHKSLYFINLVDGTCLEKLQIVLEKCDKCPTYGSSIKVEGTLLKSTHKGQEVELLANDWSLYGSCPMSYPFENNIKYAPEYIRQFPHLRPRTRRSSSILRIRSNAAMAVHQFFQHEGFYFVHTPIITRNDCEGAGEVFSIQLKEKSTKLNSAAKNIDQKTVEIEGENIEDVNEFFGVPTYLTVSGQLHLEAVACAMSRVYNFGPVFRAESSRTRQHASEFHMIEAEISFLETVEELIEMVEKCIKYVAKSIYDQCYPDLKFLLEERNKSSNNEDYLKNIINKPFILMDYKEAISILEANKEKLQVQIKDGDDLATDHKNFLTKYTNGIPVFVKMFPSLLKPFYMKTDANKTAHCFDLLASYGGEICGGSLRENNEEILTSNSSLLNDSLSWYLDLRRYGAVPHGGFGIGFDRLLQSIVGISNIRDIIPFPRRKHDCKC